MNKDVWKEPWFCPYCGAEVVHVTVTKDREVLLTCTACFSISLIRLIGKGEK